MLEGVCEMKAIYWVAWIIGVIIVLTLLSNLFFRGDFCTLIGCPCGLTIIDGDMNETDYTGERLCNTCTSANPVFVSILFNVVRDCRYSEIIICEDGEEVGERYDKENQECRYDPYVLIFNLRQLGNSNDPVSHQTAQVDEMKFPGGEF
jgi:hypothetical protein